MTNSRFALENLLPAGHLATALRSDAQRGLSAAPKWLPPKWFYDERGSALFDHITRLPEYYPTRAERDILQSSAAEIVAVAGARNLVELGSGSSEKTRLLLSVGDFATYVAVDVSVAALEAAGRALVTEYPNLAVHALVADFQRQLDRLPRLGLRMVAFLGGTIGNLVPADRARFLADLRSALEPGEALLLGTDLVKSPAVLLSAYDDAAGVTAEFNRNVLHVLNRELGADFDVAAFDHVTRWDAEAEWIEMRLRSARPQAVHVAALALDVEFAAGEEMRTEISAKFRRAGVAAELSAAGFTLTHWWTDPAGRFALSLSRA